MTDLNKVGKFIEKALRKPISQVRKFLKRNPWAWILVALVLAAVLVSSAGIARKVMSSSEEFGSNEDLYGAATGVRELSTPDFVVSSDIALKDYLGKKGLVVFYANWCGHCKKMVPDTIKAAQEINKAKSFIAAVNCVKHKDLAEKVGVKGYPTIKLVTADGRMHDYEGDRSADGMVKAVQ